MSFLRTPGVLLLSLLLAACATRIPVSAPLAGVTLPAAWAQPVTVGRQPLAQWWRAFDDPLLVELVEAALAANTDVAIATANLRQARAVRDEAAAALLPQLSVSASAQRGAVSGGAMRNLFQAGFDASWEADLFGANRHAVAAQEANARASEATLAGTQVSVAAEVALDYLQLRGAQVRAAVARENLASQRETLQISQWRQQAGLANAVEVEQARSAVEQTRAQLPALQAAAAQSAHALGVLTGRTPQALLARLTIDRALPQPTQDLAVALPAQALRQRPDVLAAERRLDAAAESVAQADAQRYPGAQLAASLAWSGATIGSLGTLSAARALLASVSQPLFDGGVRNARVAEREAAFDAARESYRASVLGALRDVEDALVALASDRERLAALQQALDAARNAALLATQRHASGLIDFQTVLETQRTLLNVQDSVAAAETELASAHVRLYKALGGGWSAAAPENPA